MFVTSALEAIPLAVRQCAPQFFRSIQVGGQQLKFRSFAEIHAATVDAPDTARGLASLVAQNRGPGIAEHLSLFAQYDADFETQTSGWVAGNTLQVANIRRKPNCFTLLHQNRLLSKYGSDSGILEKAWLQNIETALKLISTCFFAKDFSVSHQSCLSTGLE